MAISDEWMEKLLLYDFISTKKGRGQSSLLIQGVGKGRSKKRKRQEAEAHRQDLMSDGNLSHISQGLLAPMDVARYAKKRKVQQSDMDQAEFK